MGKPQPYRTQPYIFGKEIHSEDKTEVLWDIFMVGLGGFPIMRDLSKEAADFIVDSINSNVPDEFVGKRFS